MGNLPTSRTETCIPGAPVSPNLINEIQDNIIAGSRGVFKRAFTPSFWWEQTPGLFGANPSGNNPANAIFSPCFRATSAITGSVAFRIPFEPGETITGLSIPIIGNSSATFNMTIEYYSSMSVVSTLLCSATLSPPASWTSFAPTFTQQLLGPGAFLSAIIGVIANPTTLAAFGISSFATFFR